MHRDYWIVQTFKYWFKNQNLFKSHQSKSIVDSATSFHENLDMWLENKAHREINLFYTVGAVEVSDFFLIQSFECCGSGFITKTVPK